MNKPKTLNTKQEIEDFADSISMVEKDKSNLIELFDSLGKDGALVVCENEDGTLAVAATGKHSAAGSVDELTQLVFDALPSECDTKDLVSALALVLVKVSSDCSVSKFEVEIENYSLVVEKKNSKANIKGMEKALKNNANSKLH